MIVRIVDADDPAWPAFLEAVPHDFHHLPGYAVLEARRIGGQPLALHVVDGDRALLLPLIVRPIEGSTVDAVSPYGYPGPLVAGPPDPGFMGRALAAIVADRRAAGWVSIFIRAHPLLNQELPTGIGVVGYEGETVAIDLRVPVDQRWRDIRRQHRQKIVHALDAGATASFDDDWRHYETFKQLYTATMRRVGAAPEYLFDDAYYDGLRAALGERLHLMVVEIAGAVAATVLFVESCGIVEYHLMGVDEVLMRHTPSALALSSAADWAAERGDAWLMLGGGVGPANDSLLHFKAGFSPCQFPFRSLRLIVDDAEYARLAAAAGHGPARPVEAGFFPIYRSPART